MEPPPYEESTPLRETGEVTKPGLSSETTQDISNDTFNSTDVGNVSMDTFISKDTPDTTRQVYFLCC